ncbi:EexN family lipoprotein [Pseudomonas aeruginosa]|uniref:EexN family lipoprotein n=1 Tax=Pseudomonas aeruginosa TaxID=287 RepID=UPI000B4CE6AF|nr:EexN family lipoprotein [Pseudomonas aeruginosa]ASD18404.1 entry exclusion lipoprotein TrbK [Pseudomonas aeruginosa]AVZ19212.1 entry exclusion lipoprotein TrbK [Pseudomonas aeruginosa]MBG4510794.1 EexN family lipoprotein [Pseudomonas aeruginosa]MBX5738687.1 EexN family lipoprotein [Pseudomonas aeruginosa]MBX6056379.1 EexN family lipoprotein [Pseudomonas aeruginosa]
MKKVMPFLCVLALTACGQPDAPTPSALPTVDELAADPVRRKELREQCKLERAQLGDELCNRVAEATRKRFYGDGKVPYTLPKEPPKF